MKLAILNYQQMLVVAQDLYHILVGKKQGLKKNVIFGIEDPLRGLMKNMKGMKVEFLT